MPARVLLIRHPESAWNRQGIYQGRTDTPLSELGQIQAKAVAARLSRDKISGVVSSPLRRAKTLAQEIARHHGLPVEPDERLTEIHHGPWQGLHRDDVERKYPDMWRAWQERPHDVTFPNGESLQDVHRRAVPVVAEMLRRPADGTWVVVTHDTICRLVVAAAEQRPVVGFSDVSLENAGITTLRGPELIGSVEQVNDVEHLGEHRVNLEGQAL